jgi:hypothetical protein
MLKGWSPYSKTGDKSKCLSRSQCEELWRYIEPVIPAAARRVIEHPSWDFYKNWQIKLVLKEGTSTPEAVKAAKGIEEAVRAARPLGWLADRWPNIVCRKEQKEEVQMQSRMLLSARDFLLEVGKDVRVQEKDWTFDWIAGELYIAKPHDLRVGCWNRRRREWQWDVSNLAVFGYVVADLLEKWPEYAVKSLTVVEAARFGHPR